MTEHSERTASLIEAAAAPLHPSRVTARGPALVTGILPICPTCPLVFGHDERCLTQADVEGVYVLDREAPNGYRLAE